MRSRQAIFLGLALVVTGPAAGQEQAAIPLPSLAHPIELDVVYGGGTAGASFVYYQPLDCPPARTTGFYHVRDHRDPSAPPRYDAPDLPEGELTYCDGKLARAWFYKMTYAEFQRRVAAGTLTDAAGNAITTELPDIQGQYHLAASNPDGVLAAWRAKLSPQPAIVASRPTPPPPPGYDDRIAQAAAAAYSRAPGPSLALRTGSARLIDNQIVANSSMMRFALGFSARNARCTPLANKVLRCRYDIGMQITLTLFGRGMTKDSGWISRSDDFVERNGQLQSATLDRTMAAAAAAGDKNSQSRDTSSDYDPNKQYGIPDINGTMCELGSKSYCH